MHETPRTAKPQPPVTQTTDMAPTVSFATDADLGTCKAARPATGPRTMPARTFRTTNIGSRTAMELFASDASLELGRNQPTNQSGAGGQAR